MLLTALPSRSRVRKALLLLGLCGSLTGHAAELVDAPAAPLVVGHCSACHSLNLVTSQRGDRAFWLKTIRWMQETQNLWPIPAEHENQILDYLAEHYAETDWGRRPPLAQHLLPSEK